MFMDPQTCLDAAMKALRNGDTEGALAALHAAGPDGAAIRDRLIQRGLYNATGDDRFTTWANGAQVPLDTV